MVSGLHDLIWGWLDWMGCQPGTGHLEVFDPPVLCCVRRQLHRLYSFIRSETGKGSVFYDVLKRINIQSKGRPDLSFGKLWPGINHGESFGKHHFTCKTFHEIQSRNPLKLRALIIFYASNTISV